MTILITPFITVVISHDSLLRQFNVNQQHRREEKFISLVLGASLQGVTNRQLIWAMHPVLECILAVYEEQIAYSLNLQASAIELIEI
jgi:hypothetical protein